MHVNPSTPTASWWQRQTHSPELSEYPKGNCPRKKIFYFCKKHFICVSSEKFWNIKIKIEVVMSWPEEDWRCYCCPSLWDNVTQKVFWRAPIFKQHSGVFLSHSNANTSHLIVVVEEVISWEQTAATKQYRLMQMSVGPQKPMLTTHQSSTEVSGPGTPPVCPYGQALNILLISTSWPLQGSGYSTGPIVSVYVPNK